jgi:phage tail-like protein
MPKGISPGLAPRFAVDMGELKNMYFTACDGLGAKYEVETYAEGGNAGYTHQLPVRLTYTNVRLTRPVDRDSGRIAAWFGAVQRELTRVVGAITVYDGNGDPVATWNLVGVWPIRYTGPQLRADGTGVAVETVELAHEGFTVTAG